MNGDTRTEQFATPAAVKLRVDIPWGSIKVKAEATATTRIELVATRGGAKARQMIAEAEIAQKGDEISVIVERRNLGWFLFGGGIEANIVVPVDSIAQLSTGSGRIETDGPFGDVNVWNGSGSIHLEDCGEVRARTGSGNISVVSSSGSVDAKTGSGTIEVGKVHANARIATGSGNAELGDASGDAKLSTASGSIKVGRAGDMTEAFTGSGSIRIERADHGRVRAKTGSGGVSVGVVDGAAAYLDISTMSGRVNSDLREGAAPLEGEKQVELIITTMSGNVNLTRVAA